MEIIRDESFGVIPVIKERNEWLVLLVHQISYRGKDDRFWTFPKGHAEENETRIETAKRELLEETGIRNVQLIEGAAFKAEYTFTHEGKRIQKTVTHYLGVCDNKETQISLPDEIADLEWFTFKNASQKLTHKPQQRVLMETGQYINQHLEKI